MLAVLLIIVVIQFNSGLSRLAASFLCTPTTTLLGLCQQCGCAAMALCRTQLENLEHLDITRPEQCPVLTTVSGKRCRSLLRAYAEMLLSGPGHSVTLPVCFDHLSWCVPVVTSTIPFEESSDFGGLISEGRRILTNKLSPRTCNMYVAFWF